MPELPEVETIARGLDRQISGKIFASAEVFRSKAVVTKEAAPLGALLAGDRVARVGRRGKLVRIALESGRELVVHLRMTGRLIVQHPPPAPPEPASPGAIGSEGPEAPASGPLAVPSPSTPYPYTTVALDFVDGTRLCFADVRRFGRMRLAEPEDGWAADYGDEPLADEFTFGRFSDRLAGRTTPIKSLLLDQRRIAGIGNIYACEALWAARIRPDRSAGSLTRPARLRLYEAIRDVLARAIEMRGTSVDDYVDADGLKGGFQNVLSVYGKAGRPCSRCNRTLVRTVIGQRGTFWCRSCQSR